MLPITACFSPASSAPQVRSRAAVMIEVSPAMRATLALLFFQMLGTITPIFLFPELVFTRVPYAPTLEGQYIIKNLVLISAAITIGATVRGGGLVASPVVARLDDSKR